MPFATAWVKPEDAVLSEISQTEQEYNIISFICVLKNNELISENKW